MNPGLDPAKRQRKVMMSAAAVSSTGRTARKRIVCMLERWQRCDWEKEDILGRREVDYRCCRMQGEQNSETRRVRAKHKPLILCGDT